MLKFDPRRAFGLRGIKNDLTFMIKNGFIRSTASNLLNFNVAAVRFDHLERLCLLLRCTPNDLFDWKPPKDAVIDDAHPLMSLKRGPNPKNISDIVSDLPLDKLDQVEGLLNQLRESKIEN